MSSHRSCFVCKSSLESSIKHEPTKNYYFKCQSCKKTYYKIWGRVFERLFLEVYQYYNRMEKFNKTIRKQELIKKIREMDIFILTKMVHQILNSAGEVSSYCVKFPFDDLGSYKNCDIKCKLCRFKFILFEMYS